MKKCDIGKILFIATSTLLIILLFTYFSLEFYDRVVEPRKIENTYNVKLINKEIGQFATIHYCKSNIDDSNCYVLEIFGKETKWEIVYGYEGVSKEYAEQSIKEIGYNVDYSFLKYRPSYKEEDVAYKLTWKIYYDRTRSKYIEVDFITGKILSEPKI